MLNFTVGPVMSAPEVNAIANESAPYFRTADFSDIMFENEKMLLELSHAPDKSRCVFFTASGTAAMESCVMNLLNRQDNVIIINGGSFGERFVQLCKLHKRNYTEVKCKFGKQLQLEQLARLEVKKYTALLVNMDETSSGLLYDMNMISEFCKKNRIFLIVDAISSFLADELDMTRFHAGAVIISSQKALAVQPGISAVALSPEALERVEQNEEKSMYLSMKDSLNNALRGQTPFTPAVTILLQINARLRSIVKNGGALAEQQKIAHIAKEFRKGISDLPFDFVAESPSNAVTALHPKASNARNIVDTLMNDYGIWVCPNGGDKADSVFRVGHIGYITPENNQTLLNAFHDMNIKKLL